MGGVYICIWCKINFVHFQADLFLLTTSEPNSLCYIETAELDGYVSFSLYFCLQDGHEMFRIETVDLLRCFCLLTERPTWKCVSHCQKLQKSTMTFGGWRRLMLNLSVRHQITDLPNLKEWWNGTTRLTQLTTTKWFCEVLCSFKYPIVGSKRDQARMATAIIWTCVVFQDVFCGIRSGVSGWSSLLVRKANLWWTVAKPNSSAHISTD